MARIHHMNIMVLALLIGTVMQQSHAATSALTRQDIPGSDIDCGQGGTRCRVCGDINTVESSCQSNPTCVAFTFDNSCGFLKSATGPTSYREGFTVFVLTDKGGAPVPPPAAAAAPAPTAGTAPVQVSTSSSAPAAAAASTPPPAAAASPSPSPSPPPSPSPSASPSPSPQVVYVEQPAASPSQEPPAETVQVSNPTPEQHTTTPGSAPGFGWFGGGGGSGSSIPIGFLPGRKLLRIEAAAVQRQ